MFHTSQVTSTGAYLPTLCSWATLHRHCRTGTSTGQRVGALITSASTSKGGKTIPKWLTLCWSRLQLWPNVKCDCIAEISPCQAQRSKNSSDFGRILSSARWGNLGPRMSTRTFIYPEVRDEWATWDARARRSLTPDTKEYQQHHYWTTPLRLQGGPSPFCTHTAIPASPGISYGHRSGRWEDGGSKEMESNERPPGLSQL